jgi:hypothetical protein
LMLTHDRCRGCGGRGKQAHLAAEPVPQSRNRMGDVNRLCERCRRVVERMRRDSRVTAVFIFSLGKKTKYYAVLKSSTW